MKINVLDSSIYNLISAGGGGQRAAFFVEEIVAKTI